MLIHSAAQIKCIFNHRPFKCCHKISFNKAVFFFFLLFICETKPIIRNLTIWCFHRPCYFITIIVIWCSIQMRSAWINATRYFIAFNSLRCFSGRTVTKSSSGWLCATVSAMESKSENEKKEHTQQHIHPSIISISNSFHFPWN